MPRERLVTILEGRYSEQPVAAGLEVTGQLIEVFATADRETWTLVMSTPNDMACVIAVGTGWFEKVNREGTY